MDCDYVATAGSKEEVMDMAMAHAVEAHADVLQGLSTEETEAMNAKLAGVIKETEEELIAEDVTTMAVMDGEEDEAQGEEEGEDSEEEAVAEDADGDEAEVEEEEDSKEETTEVA